MDVYFNAEAATLVLLLAAGLICLIFVVACILCFALSIVEDADVGGIDFDDALRRIDRRHDRPHH